MRTHVVSTLRAAALAGALVASLAGIAGAQDAPSAAVLGDAAGSGGDGDAVRITHTADGQLFLRIQGSRAAMLLLDESAGRTFVAALRAYLAQSAAGCAASETSDAIPRLTAPRAHRSGINGIAVRCAAAEGGATYAVLITRPGGEDGPAIEPLAIQVDEKSVRAFAAVLARLSGDS